MSCYVVHACFKYMNFHVKKYALSNESLHHNLSVTTKLQNTFKQLTFALTLTPTQAFYFVFMIHLMNIKVWSLETAHDGNLLFYSQVCSVWLVKEFEYFFTKTN